MLSSLPEIREQDLPHSADRLRLPMPNCSPISLLLVAGLVSAARVLSRTATLSLYLCRAAALSLLSFQLPPQGAPVIQVINNNNNNAEAG